jgi:3-oxoacyl-[acyl-carrier protein] reductase
MAAHGAHVLVHARRSRERVEEVAARIRQQNRESIVLMADLAEAATAGAFAGAAWDQFGPIDVWVNNAGVDTLTGANAQASFDNKLAQLWSVDVQATITLSRDVGARMRQRGKGVIINIGWDQAETGMEGDSGQLFAATKGAVMAFTKSLAASLAPQVRVNCVAPGWIKTAWGEGASTAWQERARREAPLERWGTPADVAAACCWLASSAAAFVTGQIIRVNGGAVR